MTRPLRFGVNISKSLRDDYSKMNSIAERCDALGFGSFWIPDHFFFGPEFNAYLETWTVQTALASITKRLKFGNIVLCNSYRHPPVLAKMAATLAS